MLLFVRGEKVCDYLTTTKIFWRIFATTIGDVYVRVGNHESFAGNEYEDVKQ